MSMFTRRLVCSLWLFCMTTADVQAQAVHIDEYVDEYYVPLGDQGVRLFVREYGHGDDPVVVLHGGWGAEHSYMLGLIRPHFEACRFVVYDQRGSLRSPAPVAGISVDQHVEDLEQLRIELGLPSIRIVAHSMGSFLAMSYLAKYPDRVRDLTMIGAIPPEFDGKVSMGELFEGGASELMARPEIAEQRELMQLPAEPNARDATHSWRLEFASVNLHHVDRWRQMPGGQIFYNPEAGQAAAKSMPAQWDFLPALREHAHPVHVAIGHSDFIDLGGKRWEAAKVKCPNLQLHLIPEAGHAAWIDQPDVLEGILRSCVAKLDRAARQAFLRRRIAALAHELATLAEALEQSEGPTHK